MSDNNLEGLDAVQRNLKRRVQDIRDTVEESSDVRDLLTPEFIQTNTKFQTIDDMLAAGSIQDSSELTGEGWNSFVAANSPFENWQDFITAAFAFRVRKNLGG